MALAARHSPVSLIHLKAKSKELSFRVEPEIERVSQGLDLSKVTDWIYCRSAEYQRQSAHD